MGLGGLNLVDAVWGLGGGDRASQPSRRTDLRRWMKRGTDMLSERTPS